MGAGRPRKQRPDASPKVPATRKPAEEKTAAEAEKVNVASDDSLSPLEYMLQVIRDPKTEESRRDRMAVAAAPYFHSKASDGSGAKVKLKQAAADAAKGNRFSPAQPPKLIVNNRR